MTKRSIVLLTAVVALAIFSLAAFVYPKPEESNPALVAPVAAPPVAVPPAADQLAGDSLIRPHSPIVGAVDAPVTIVEFLDPSCEACRLFFPHVKEILERHPGEVRVVVRYAPFHKGSDEAVRILEAARLQGIFESILEVLFAEQPTWASHHAPDLNKAWEIAATKGLDIARAQIVPALSDVKALLDQEMADMQVNNVKFTPTFFINGMQYPNILPERLKEIVASEVQNAKAKRNGGQNTPPEGEVK